MRHVCTVLGVLSLATQVSCVHNGIKTPDPEMQIILGCTAGLFQSVGIKTNVETELPKRISTGVDVQQTIRGYIFEVLPKDQALKGYELYLGCYDKRKAELLSGPTEREKMITAVGGIRRLRGEYGFALANDRTAASKALREGPGAIAQLEAVDPSKLWDGDRMHRSAYIGLGYLYLGLLWDLTEPSKERALQYVSSSLAWSAGGLSQYQKTMADAERTANQAKGRYARWRQWVIEDRYEEFLYQNIGRAHLLAHKLGQPHYSNAVQAFQKISRSYIDENGLLNEPVVRWFCASYPREDAVCGQVSRAQ